MDLQIKTLLKDFQAMREEILARVKLMFWTINLGVILEVIFLVIYPFIPSSFRDLYLLLITLIFAGLIFNYQGNQATMEVVARYINHVLRPKIEKLAGTASVDWEDHWFEARKYLRITSFLKLIPLILPLLIPIVMISHEGFAASTLQKSLEIFDLIIIVIVIFNFCYKIRSLKK